MSWAGRPTEEGEGDAYHANQVRTYILTHQSNIRKPNKSKWVSKYRQQVKDRRSFHARRKDRIAQGEDLSGEEALPVVAAAMGMCRKSMHSERFLTPHPTLQDVVPKQAWTSEHNDVCEISGLEAPPNERVECRLCPVVVHLDYMDRVDEYNSQDKFGSNPKIKKIVKERYSSKTRKNSKSNQTLTASKSMGSFYKSNGQDDFFICPFCEEDITSSKALLDHRRKTAFRNFMEERSALTLQSLFRKQLAYTKWQIARKGIYRLAAVFRGGKTREAFKHGFWQNKRAFVVRIISAHGIYGADRGGVSDPYVLFSCVRGEYDKQLFRYDTKVKRETVNPVWNEKLLIPGCDGDASLVFTVIDKDDCRHDFLGQAYIKPSQTEVWKGPATLTFELGPKYFQPKEANMTQMRLGRTEFAGQGSLKVEIISLPHMHSHCSFIEEKNSTMSMRKFWAVLAEGKFNLFKHYGKMHPDQVIPLKNAIGASLVKVSRVETKYRHCTFCAIRFKSGVFADHVDSNSSTWSFQVPDLQKLCEWTVKLQRTIDDYKTAALKHT